MSRVIMRYDTTITGWGSIKPFLNSDFDKENIEKVIWKFNELKFTYYINANNLPNTDIESVLSMEYIDTIKKITDKSTIFDGDKSINKITPTLTIHYTIWEK